MRAVGLSAVDLVRNHARELDKQDAIPVGMSNRIEMRLDEGPEFGQCPWWRLGVYCSQRVPAVRAYAAIVGVTYTSVELLAPRIQLR